MPGEIAIPFETEELRAPLTDALQDLDIRIRQSLDFCGGILYLFGRSSPESFTPGGVRFEWRGPLQGVQPEIEVHLTTHGVKGLPRVLPARLFASGVTQLAAAFEAYVGDVLADVYFNNESLLQRSERQLSAEEILDLGSVEQIKQHLIEDAIAGVLASSYPRLVRKLERSLHIGLHSKKSPVPKADAHHFFEVRNIIVHNEGRASPQYLNRMKAYADDPPADQLSKKGESFPVDFHWLFAQGKMLLKLGAFMDKEITEKWTTTAAPGGKPAMFWYGMSE